MSLYESVATLCDVLKHFAPRGSQIWPIFFLNESNEVNLNESKMKFSITTDNLIQLFKEMDSSSFEELDAYYNDMVKSYQTYRLMIGADTTNNKNSKMTFTIYLSCAVLELLEERLEKMEPSQVVLEMPDPFAEEL